LHRLRELEAENAKLKRIYADLALENNAIRDVLNRKSVPVRLQACRGQRILFDNIRQVQEITLLNNGYMNTTKTVPTNRWGILHRRNLCLG
jgi:hypothetical protein